MKRILLLVTVALVMATMVIVSALPAIAAPPTITVSCYTQEGVLVSSVTSDGGGFSNLAYLRSGCNSLGYVVTQEVTPTPG